MPEKREELAVYAVEYFCDKCGEVMMWNGVCLTSNPAQYPHVCVNGHTKNFLCSYPRKAYVYKEKVCPKCKNKIVDGVCLECNYHF